MSHAREAHGLSERRACLVVKQPRGTQRYRSTQRDDEEELTRAIVTLASQYGRYGYRRITALLRRAGWNVGKDRAERIWRREGLKVPKKQKPSAKVIEALADVMVMKGVPEHIRSDNGPEFVARDLRKWLTNTSAKTLYIEPGSPWETATANRSTRSSEMSSSTERSSTR